MHLIDHTAATLNNISRFRVLSDWKSINNRREPDGPYLIAIMKAMAR